MNIEGTTEAAFTCADGRFLSLNHAAAALFDAASPEALVGAEVLSRIAPECHHLVAAKVAAPGAPDPSPSPCELDVLGAGGAPVAVECRFVPAICGGQDAWLVFATDIRARRREAETVRFNEELLRTVFDNSPIGLEIFDRNTTVMKCNRTAFEMFGTSSEEVIGKFDLRTDPNYQDEAVWEAIARGEQIRHEISFDFDKVEYATNKNGRTYYDAIMTPVAESVSHEIGYIMQLIDITDRRRAEEERSELQAQLFQVQKLESIGTLAAGIAHDFNNLLTGLLGPLSLMEKELGPDHPMVDGVGHMMTLIDRGAGLTRQLLGFARQGKYDPHPIDLHRSLDNALSLFAPTHKDITIQRTRSRETPGGPAIVVADIAQMDQVILNLLGNASDAMPDGGELRVDVQTVDLSEDVTASYGVSPGPFVELCIADTGTGMDPETCKRIFEPFFTTKGIGKGTGLGLASVHGIVTKHGGFVTVKSDPGTGSVFRVYLPASDAPVRAADQSPNTTLGRGETILVVDDEKVINDVTVNVLKHLGYQTLSAGNGAEAIEIFKANHERVAAVVLDLIMPGMSGRQVFDALRALREDIKVLMVSGYSMDEQTSQILKQGGTGFILKPYNLDSLSAKVAELLDR